MRLVIGVLTCALSLLLRVCTPMVGQEEKGIRGKLGEKKGIAVKYEKGMKRGKREKHMGSIIMTKKTQNNTKTEGTKAERQEEQ